MPWWKLDASKATDEVGDRVEVFCTEELKYLTKFPRPRFVALEVRKCVISDALGL